jgi:hypothetical protein
MRPEMLIQRIKGRGSDLRQAREATRPRRLAKSPSTPLERVTVGSRYQRTLGNMQELPPPDRWLGGPRTRGGSTSPLYVADVRLDGERKFFFIQNTLSDQDHQSAQQIRIWRASGRRLPMLTDKIDLITDWIPSGSLISDWFRISHPAGLYCNVQLEQVAICTEFLDSSAASARIW